MIFAVFDPSPLTVCRHIIIKLQFFFTYITIIFAYGLYAPSSEDMAYNDNSIHRVK